MIDAARDLYHETKAWRQTYWLGTRMVKCPLDAWVMQEIIAETRPDWIIETGTHSGGSALFFASVCEMLRHGRVVSVDIQERKPEYPHHSRLMYLAGFSSTAPRTVSTVASMVGTGRAMLVLDSDHSQEHVEAELEAYQAFVPPGGYAVVEDTNFGDYYPELLPGPAEAVEAFLSRHPEWEIDPDREKHGITFNPGGYLRRR